MWMEIPDSVVRQAETNATEMALLLAVQLYADNRIDHGAAARLARVSPASFTRELLRRSLGVQVYPSQPQREAS